MLAATLTTAATCLRRSASALTRSRSWWSMMAMSPGASRLVRILVRLSSLAGPVTPGRSSVLVRCVMGRLRNWAIIGFHTATDHGYADRGWPASPCRPWRGPRPGPVPGGLRQGVRGDLAAQVDIEDAATGHGRGRVVTGRRSRRGPQRGPGGDRKPDQ